MSDVFEAILECPVDLPEALDYEQALHFTQGIRRMVVHGLVKTGVPTDKDGVDMLLKALQHMDQTTLGDRKNKIDADGVSGAKEVFENMLEMVKMQANGNPFMRKPDGTPLDPEVLAQTVPSVDVSKLGEHESVDGEMEIGIINENATEFFARMNHRKPELDANDPV